MRTVTISLDESIYQKFMTLVELFPKSKLKIAEESEAKPNKETLKVVRDIEEGKNCESFASTKDMFKSYGI